MAQSTSNAITNTLKASTFDVVSTQLDSTLQNDLSYCYDKMLYHLRSTGRFNEAWGLTRGGFNLESTNEHGIRDGQFFTAYSLDPSKETDKFTSHCFEDDEEWKEYYEEYLRIENRANVLGINLIFDNEEEQ